MRMNEQLLHLSYLDNYDELTQGMDDQLRSSLNNSGHFYFK